MSKGIKPQDLGQAIAQELTLYHENVTERIDTLSQEAVKELVKKTRTTAPVGERGTFRKKIASKQLKKSKNGSTYVWYVKAPDYRLTHLLVHGHATKNGGRTRPDPFLKNAVDAVIPAWEKDVEEALKNDK